MGLCECETSLVYIVSSRISRSNKVKPVLNRLALKPYIKNETRKYCLITLKGSVGKNLPIKKMLDTILRTNYQILKVILGL